jgi:RND family efflux transporter MFP subunit
LNIAMKTMFRNFGRVAVTLVVVAVAALAGWHLWDSYMRSPWTRDARLRADVVSVTPDVSGLVSEVAVNDNAKVNKGDLLFRIDRQRFAIAFDRAAAAAQSSQAALEQAQRDLQRYQRLSGVVSEQQREEASTAEAKAEADYHGAVAAREAAALDLKRSEVRAPVNGIITNLSLRPGDYVSAGKAVMALVDADSFRVEGYFEETKLPRIRLGAPVSITLMGQEGTIRGHVEGIAAGIEDRERSDASGSLANVNPSFAWVRLAQRVPVRIALDSVPDGMRLVAGLTATVVVQP